jgi:hypothetical protein
VEIDIANEQHPDGVAVRVKVRLSGREANRLFLAGDSLIQLPLEGAVPDLSGSPIPRYSIFLSELAGQRDGLLRVFAETAAAEAFARTVRTQLESALEVS